MLRRRHGLHRERGGRVSAIGTRQRFVRWRVRRFAPAPKGRQQSRRHSAGIPGIFLYPGYQFRVVDAMITNFRLPESTLIMLVSAFAGVETIRDAYRVAVENRYRFFSYGDAMFLARKRVE